MKFVVAASGESVEKTDFAQLRDCEEAGLCKVITVNRTCELYPFATFHYAGDRAWWEMYGKDCAARGEKWTRDIFSAKKFRLKKVILQDFRGVSVDRWIVYSGGNSGYQAVNLAYLLGASQICLIGFDMHRKTKGHFFGEYPNGMLSAPQLHIDQWKRQFTHMAADFAKLQIPVFNATPGSALHCFPRRDLFDFIGANNENSFSGKARPKRTAANRRRSNLDCDGSKPA